MKRLRVGLDFDNTIACYDSAFLSGLEEFYLKEKSVLMTKSAIKEYLLSQDEGEYKWQRLQGQVYGKLIERAHFFPGFIWFLWLCRINKATVFIVSHKTEYGHFDSERINLREAALKWMEKRKIFSGEYFDLRVENVFFETTREQKIERIQSLNVDIFVDDLIEVLEDANFPRKSRAIFFNSTSEIPQSLPPNTVKYGTWHEITESIFPGSHTKNILSIAQLLWPELEFLDVTSIKGHGNSRILRLISASASYALKIYPDLTDDPRQRLEIEYYVCDRLKKIGLPVPKAVGKCTELNWGLFEWIEGEAPLSDRSTAIKASIGFLAKLHEQREALSKADFPFASEACLSGIEIERQILVRVEKLLKIDDLQLKDYLEKELIPAFKKSKRLAKNGMGAAYHQELPIDRLTLSPSDFGFHNLKVSADGQFRFLDFEYFGWDDPVKLVSDCLWHPGMTLDEAECRIWSELAGEVYSDDIDYKVRLKHYHPMLGIRWCLILLNEFLKERFKNRVNADPSKHNKQIVEEVQLTKSKSLLVRVASILKE